MWKVFVYTFLSPPPSLGGKKQTQDSGQTPTPHSIFFRREKWKQFKTFKKSSIHSLQWEEIFWWLFTLSIGMVKPIWFMFSSEMKKFWTTFNLLPHSICLRKENSLELKNKKKLNQIERSFIKNESHWFFLSYFTFSHPIVLKLKKIVRDHFVLNFNQSKNTGASSFFISSQNKKEKCWYRLSFPFENHKTELSSHQ